MSRQRSAGKGPALGPTLEFLRSLWRTNHAIERVSSSMTQTLGITAQQRMVLRILGRHPGMTGSQLAAELHLDRGTVSTTLGNLERRGLLTRRRDQADRRSSTIHLSAAGRELDHPATGTIEHAVGRLLQRAPRARIRTCLGILGDLVVLLDAEADTRPSRRASVPARGRRRKANGRKR